MRIQSGGGLRSYTIDGRDINSISFFGHGRIFACVERGWLEHQAFKKDGTPESFTHDVVWIDIPSPALARKQDLFRTNSFIMGTRKGTIKTSEPGRYDLYIYSKPPKDVNEKLVLQTSTNKMYSTFATFDLSCGARHYKETEEATGRHLYDVCEQNEIRIAIAHRSEKTSHGNQVDALLKEIKAKDIKIDEYVLGKLLQHYDLIPKKS